MHSDSEKLVVYPISYWEFIRGVCDSLFLKQKPSNEVEGIVHRSPRQDCVEAQKIVASIILKWKKFGTTKTLPRAGGLAKLSNGGRRTLFR